MTQTFLFIVITLSSACSTFHRMKDCHVAINTFGRALTEQLQDPDKDFLCRTPNPLTGK